MALLMTLAVSCLAACTQDPSAVELSSTSAVGARPTVSATPTVTPRASHPAGDPEDPTTWLVSQDALGPIQLGMAFFDALGMMPAGAAPIAADCPSAFEWIGPETFGARLRVARAVDGDDLSPVNYATWVYFNDGSAFIVEVPSPHTAEGIGLGTLLDDVRVAYPGVQEIPVNDGVQDLLNLRIGQIWFTAFSGHDRVDQITITTAEVADIEVCT